MAKRKGLSKRARFEVFKRDGFICQYCGRTPPAVILHADHIVAIANGGDDSISNMVTSCADCNLGKSDRPLTAVVPSRQETIEREKELAEQTQAYNDFLLTRRQADDDAIKRLGLHWYNQIGNERDAYVFGPDRIRSVRRFLRDLTEAEVLDAIDEAHRRLPAPSVTSDDRTFRYFCGICWGRIKGATE